jgi:molybdopterin-synthase adenylyltransferase
MVDRYMKQMLFPAIGNQGQKKLSSSFVTIVGCGALGSIIATALVRAGVGRVRIVDRDFIEYHNLHRQMLFDEEDVKEGLPKAVAAERHLKRVNSTIQIESIVADVNYSNIESIVAGSDLILDGLDNLETRYILNDISMKLKIPWVYGAVVSSLGMTMDILPDHTPCLQCLSSNISTSRILLTSDTVGVISQAPFIIGSLQSVEAIKILIGAQDINRDLIFIDVWKGLFKRFKVFRNAECLPCHGTFKFLEAKFGTRTMIIRGQNAVQILSSRAEMVSFKELATRLAVVGKVTYNDFVLTFTEDTHEIAVFPDGRVIVKNTVDESLARRLYTKYIET